LPHQAPQPEALPGLKTIAPHKRRNADSWTAEENSFADACLKVWNDVFADKAGGWRASNVYANRHLAVFLCRAGAFTLDEVLHAIRAYGEDPANKRLNNGGGSWRRFADWFDRQAVEERIDHQLRRIGYKRKPPPPSPEAVAVKRAQVRRKAAEQELAGSTWMSLWQRGKREGRTGREQLLADRHQADAKGSIAMNHSERNRWRWNSSLCAARVAQLAVFDALPADSRQGWMNAGATLFRDYHGREAVKEDAPEVAAMAITLWDNATKKLGSPKETPK